MHPHHDAGRPPFLGDDSVAIIGQHINTPPVAPTWHNSECPKSLEALILRLLAKDPQKRPKSAADALAALESVDLSVVFSDTDSKQDVAHALDSLAGGVFVGPWPFNYPHCHCKPFGCAQDQLRETISPFPPEITSGLPPSQRRLKDPDS